MVERRRKEERRIVDAGGGIYSMAEEGVVGPVCFWGGLGLIC